MFQNKNQRVKILSIDFLVFLFMVLFVGKGSSFVSIFTFSLNPIGLSLYFAAILYLLINSTHEPTSQKYKSIIAIFLGWMALHLVFLDHNFEPYYYFPLIMHSMAGYGVARHYGKSIIDYYVKAMAVLSVVSIALWGVQLFGGTSILTSLPFATSNTSGNSEYSLIIYTISSYGGVDYLLRNSGCAWEPGLYSVMICIAIVFRIYQQGGVLKIIDCLMLLFVFTLTTTFSTTGYILVMAVFALTLLLSSKMGLLRKTVLGVIGIFVFSWVYSLPFISEKIEEKSDVNNFFTESGEYLQRKEQFTVDRFEGMFLDLQNIGDKPVVGYGLDNSNSYIYNNISQLIQTSNGLTKPMAMYGVVLGLLLLILVFQGFKVISIEKSTYAHWIFIVGFIVLSISYDLQMNPIIKALQFMALLYTAEKYKSQTA